MFLMLALPTKERIITIYWPHDTLHCVNELPYGKGDNAYCLNILGGHLPLAIQDMGLWVLLYLQCVNYFCEMRFLMFPL